MSSLLHPATLPVGQLLAECDVVRTRRSGPGGQHRNKVETAIVVLHRPTGIRGEASERRSQAQNQSEAIFRLRVKLALGVRQPVPQPHEPSGLWQSRCHQGRISVNCEHADFPALLAEALDVVVQHGAELKGAAQDLDCTPTQLLHFLQLEPRALQSVNQERERRGLHKLR